MSLRSLHKKRKLTINKKFVIIFIYKIKRIYRYEKCSDCERCLQKWKGIFFYGYVCGKTYENIIDENNPPCLNKENNNE